MAKMISSPVRVTIDSVEGKYGYTADSAGISGDGTKVTAINLYHSQNTPSESREAPSTTAAWSETPEPAEEQKHKPHLDRVLKALHDAETALLDEAQQRASFEANAERDRRTHKFAIQRALLAANHAGVPAEKIITLDGSAHDDLLQSIQSLMWANTDLDTILDV